jgi:hypothetical protein
MSFGLGFDTVVSIDPSIRSGFNFRAGDGGFDASQNLPTAAG